MQTELDLRQIFTILQKKLWLLAALTIACGAAAYLITVGCVAPKYSATASMYVYNERSRTEGITTTDLTTSQKLVQTYIVILTSNSVLDKVSAQLHGAYTAEQIRDMLTAEAISDTEAFKITVTCKDPAAAQQIANTIADVAPAEIVRVVKAGSVEVIDYAGLPAEPSSPNVPRNTVLGALVGLVLTALVLILRAMFDTVVRAEEDLTAAFHLPILGVIPAMVDSGKAGKGEGY